MTASAGVDTEELWRRVGLQELRQALIQIEELMYGFEKTLRALPPCNTCARAKLVERIQSDSHRLSREITSLSVLAESLKDALSTTEQCTADLTTNAPAPCQCTGGECTCHE
jgi:hypothetical protein